MPPFQHEALLYDGLDRFVDGALPFIREGLAAGEPVMVAVDRVRIGRLRDALGADADAVSFADMAEVGGNPGRIIPVWREFLGTQRPGAPARGLGEPISAERDADELIECQLHEALLNVAFADADGLHLVCPYDTDALRPEVLHEARCSHPLVDGVPSPEFRGTDDPLAPFDAPLPPPPAGAEMLGFERATLDEVRELVAACARDAGLPAARAADLVLAVNELATNSVRHGGGHGIVRVWGDERSVHAEVRDRGRITDPLAGRHLRQAGQIGGWGMWIAHQVSDLVQVRSGNDGTVVRLKVRCS